MPFLSLLDDRAKPKGSRDPLGFEMIWTHYGRQVIGNLTTITNSLTNFAVAILGFHWANEICKDLPDSDRHTKVRDTFLRYEQVVAYLRFLSEDTGSIMGITRVIRRMKDDQSQVKLGIGNEEQILSDQVSYGLWGLYSSAMDATRLIKGNDRIPIDQGLVIAKRIEAKLEKKQLTDLIKSKKPVSKSELNELATAFRDAIKSEKVRESLRDALLKGTENTQLQQALWSCTQEIAERKEAVNSVADFIDKVKSCDPDSELAERLSEIERVERVLVAANNIFNYCRRKDGSRIDEIVGALKQHYSHHHMSELPRLDGFPKSLGNQQINLLNKLMETLRQCDYADVIRWLLELNQFVMKRRDGAPWVHLENDKILRVKVPSETASLLDPHELESQWDYDYFIGSYITVANQGFKLGWKTR